MRKRPVRDSIRNDLSGAKQIETEGVGFLPFLAGMVTSLAMIFLIWNQIAMSLATEPATKTKDSTIDPSDVPAVVASNNPDQLANQLFELEQTIGNKNAVEQVNINLQRIKLADRMLAMDLSALQEERAKHSKLDSLSQIYGLNYLNNLNAPDIVRDLRDVAKSYAHEPNPKLARAAEMALVKVNVFELANLRSVASLQSITNEIVDLLKRYPEDDVVISTVRLVLDAYVDQNEVGGLSLIQNLCERKNEFSSSKVQAMYQDLADKALLLNAHYQRLFDDRWVNGSVGQNEILSRSIELITNPEFGSLLLLKVDEVAHWFEQEGRHENAIHIYDAMLKAADNGVNPVAATLARKTANAGIQRNKLIHKKVELSGFAPDGSAILSEEFNRRAVVVIFWSNRNAKSIEELRQFHQKTQSWTTKPIAVLAVCVDENSVEDVKQIAVNLSRFRFMVADPAGNGSNPVLEQCPSARIPRAMLIGEDGMVVDVNVPMPELKTVAEGI